MAVLAVAVLAVVTQPVFASAASAVPGVERGQVPHGHGPAERRGPARQRALAADSFVDIVGVNTHLTYGDTSYSQFASVVLPRLQQLGVRHVRDAIDTGAGAGPQTPYYQQLRALAGIGIKFDLVTSLGAGTTTDFSKLSDVVAWSGDAVQSFEGVNEPDLAVPGDWASATRTAQTQLASAVSAMGPGAPEVVLPSVTTREAAAQLGSLRSLGQAGSMHSYFGDREPETPGYGDGGYGSRAYNVRQLAGAIGPGLPVVNTETGYYTSPTSASSGVPQTVAGTYTARLLMDQFAAGIQRVYLYQLLDEQTTSSDPEANFGLLTADGTRKPAFRAVAGLVKLLRDPGPAFKPGRLRLSLRGGPSSLRHVTLQKRNGTFYVALWNPAPIWDPRTDRPLKVRSSAVGLGLPAGYRIARVDRLKPNGAMSRKRSSSASTVSVGSTLTIVEVKK